jgi:hypothetical protein
MIQNRNRIAIFKNDLKSKSNRFTKWQTILVFLVRLSACIIGQTIFLKNQKNKTIFISFYLL